MNTAFTERLKLDREHNQIIQLVNTLYHTILRDYIAHANEREVLENLYKFCADSEVTLISKQQLKVYQKLEELALDANLRNLK